MFLEVANMMLSFSAGVSFSAEASFLSLGLLVSEESHYGLLF